MVRRLSDSRLRAVIALGITLVALLAGCASQWAHREARSQLESGNFEAGLQLLDRAVRDHPDDLELRTTWLRARSSTALRLLDEATALRAHGQTDPAQRLLDRAIGLDPENVRLREVSQAWAVESRQSAALLEAQTLADKSQPAAALRLIAEALKPNPRHAELLELQRRLELAQREQQLSMARAGLSEARPVSLDFREAGLRTVLDVVTRHSGVNFVLDKDVRADLRVTVYLRNVKVEDALDLIVSTHQLAKKVLDDRTVLIYPHTPDKQREYQEQVVRVFYLANAEAKQASNLLRTVLKAREPFVDERSNLLVLREAPETIQLAERLLALYDSAEPEVVLELEVLEVSSQRLTELGIKFPDTLSLSPLAAAGASGLTVAGLRDLNSDRIGVSVAGLLLNLKRQVGDVQTLANPRVRIKHREKGRVLIGNKVPVVSTTATTGFIAENVNYLDVGLKLELEPTIAADDDVSIKVQLEVSSLGNQIKTSTGTLAYEIGTRNASTVLRLHDGQTQVLAGLVSREERSSASRLPGLGDVPLVGRLFSSQLDNGSRTELVLAITPRVVRNLRKPDANESEMWIGTEAYTRLRAPGGRVPTLTDAAVVPPTPARSTSALGVPTAPGVTSRSAEVASTSRAEGPGQWNAAPLAAPSAAPSSPPSAQATPGPAKWRLRWQSPAAVKPGEEFTVELVGQTPLAVRGMNLRLGMPPLQALMIRAAEGLWWTQDQSAASVTQAMDDAQGQWQFGVIRKEAVGVKGEGVLLSLRLKAGAAGRIVWPLLQLEPIAAGPDAPRASELPALEVEVRP